MENTLLKIVYNDLDGILRVTGECTEGIPFETQMGLPKDYRSLHDELTRALARAMAFATDSPENPDSDPHSETLRMIRQIRRIEKFNQELTTPYAHPKD